MGLYVFHCVLIASAAAFFAGFGVYALRHPERGPMYAYMGIASFAVAALVTAYLIYFVLKLIRRYTAGEIR